MSSVKASRSCSRHRSAIRLQLGAREDLARRVVGRVDDDRPGPRRDRRPELVGVDPPVRLVEGHVARDRAGQDRVRAVVLVERLEHDDLVARVEQAEHRRDHPLGRAVDDRDLGVGVDDPARDGSARSWPRSRRAAASRPNVIAYWLWSALTASATAALSSGGQAKSGKPWARLTAPAATARRFISRMTDSVNDSALRLIRSMPRIVGSRP